MGGLPERATGGGAEAGLGSLTEFEVELPEVTEESETSTAIDPLVVAFPVFPCTTVLSPTETIAPFVAITMSWPLAVTETPGTPVTPVLGPVS